MTGPIAGEIRNVIESGLINGLAVKNFNKEVAWVSKY